jgi:Leucine-rich repeat (LRR) protein
MPQPPDKEEKDEGARDVVRVSGKLLAHIPAKDLHRDRPENVVELAAERNRLTSLPDAVLAFTHLRKVNVSYNPLTRFPEVLCGLPCLVELRLVDCGLTTLSDNVARIARLETLCLDINRFSEIPECLQMLDNLKTLSMGSNLFQEFTGGHLPPSLTHLNIDNNHIRNFPWCVVRLRSLIVLNMRHNVVTSLPDEICDVTSLQELLLNSNRITALPSSICHLKELRVLELNKNQLTVLPADMRALTSLQEISIRNNPMLQPPFEMCNKVKDGVPIDITVDEIVAYQECMKAQLYAPCKRPLNVFVLGSSHAGKRDLTAFLTQQTKEGLVRGKALTSAWHEFDNLALTVYRCSGKSRYNILHQLFFQECGVYIVCVNVDKYQSFSC